MIKPGEVRNPEGNNGRTPITDSLRVILTRPLSDQLDDKPLTVAQEIAMQWAKKARAGLMPAITSLADRVEGKATESVQHSGNLSLSVATGIPRANKAD